MRSFVKCALLLFSCLIAFSADQKPPGATVLPAPGRPAPPPDQDPGFLNQLGIPSSVRALPQPKPKILDFKDGDRVVFLGDTFIEREKVEGYLETRLTARLQGKKVIFRNLGWSADTVLGESRAGFDPPEKGFDRLKEQLAAIKPTLVFLSYGMSSSFQGEEGLPKFRQDMNKLMDTIQEISKPDAVRFVLLGPIRHEKPGALPDPEKHNEQLKLYGDAIKDIAAIRGTFSVPLFDILTSLQGRNEPPLTDNGIHPTPFGYWRLGLILDTSLFGRAKDWRLGITSQGTPRTGSTGAKVTDMVKKKDSVTFTGQDELLVSAPRPDSKPGTNSGPACLMQIVDLNPGNYTLFIDNIPVAIHDVAGWDRGQFVDRGPHFEQIEELRKTIVKKNELFFYRWRPQNQTYLFGFRKYEQGQNAKEIPMFDPLISAEEEKIEKLKQFKTHHYALKPSAPDDEQKVLALLTKKAAPPKQVFKPEPLPHPNFTLDQNLEVNLFAENPDLAKPIEMNFDPQGRLWVASSSVYPQIRPGQEANDKILILEDTDGDGKVDKSTVFAEGLLIPTAVLPGDGGVYVANSTELLFFKDTDGDGKADFKRVVLSGFGTEDTHHILHTLRWGHDGQLYMNQSIYIHSHIETPHGVVRLNSGGIWNFRPDTYDLGVHMKGLVNGWGHHIDSFGQSFATDGAGSDGINWVVPQAMYVTYAGARRILGSVSPGSYPKFCSLEIIHSEQFPSDWQGTMITCDFRAHRVVRFGIDEQDSGYITKQLADVMVSTNVTFRPIDVKLGPDGALYIADWSNPIIQHGEVDFRDPRRDHEHGRIWRLSYKNRPLLKKQNLVAAANRELLDNLLSPNGPVREQSHRVLTERGEKIKSDLATWSDQQKTEQGQLEALWMYQSINVVNPELLEKVLTAKDGRVRAAAVRVVSFWEERLSNPLHLLARAVKDEHPRVRVEAARAAAKIPKPAAADLVLSILNTKLDRFLDYAVWLSINDLAKPWTQSIREGKWKTDGHEKELAYGLKAIEPALASSVIDSVLADKPIPAEGPWIELVGSAASAKQISKLYEFATAGQGNEAATAKALNSLAEAARLRNVRPSGELSGVEKLLANPNPEIKAGAARLAGQWKLAPLTPELLALVSEKSANPAVQAASFQSLREIGNDQAKAGLAELAGKTHDRPIRAEAVKALAAVDLHKAVPLAIDVLSETADDDAALNLWRALLSNKGAGGAFAQALPKANLPKPMVKAGLRAAREGGRNEPNLVLALARNVEGEEEAKQLSPGELQKLIAFIKESGDPARGEAIYRRQELGCVTCHSIGGVGGKVGPDMTSLGASAQLDYIIESVQFPNRKVKEGFHSIVVETKDDQELSGILLRETDEQLFLRDVSNKDVSVPKSNVSKRTIGGSLMPAGLIDALSEKEQADLYRFLSELGKPGPYDASKNNVARFWRLMPRTLDISQFEDEKAVSIPLTDQSWFPAGTLVDGTLPTGELEAALKRLASRSPSGIYAAARFETSKTGPVHLTFDPAPKAGVWIDGKAAGTADELTIDLPSGPHALAVRFEIRSLPEHLRLRSNDASFLTN
jgi:putative heme-binding domain-containing protein